MAKLQDRYIAYTDRVLGKRASDVELYRQELDTRVVDGARVLHLGCGWDRSNVTRPLRERAEIIGVDIDLTTASRYHSAFYLADAAALPFAASTFDVVCSEYVFEHVERPCAMMSELARVLKPGGTVVALTPSRWSYKSLAAAVTPHSFHRFAAGALRPDARAPEDVYPTRYLMNSRRALRRLAHSAGFEISRMAFLNNGPTWFRKTPGLFELGRLYHWALDVELLEVLRCGILITMTRLGEGTWAAAGSLVIRCLSCGLDGMDATSRGYVCPACGRLYRRTGTVTETTPGTFELSRTPSATIEEGV